MAASMPADSQATQPTILGRVGAWWKVWRERRATLAGFALYRASERDLLGRDVGLDGRELRVLAGKWPDSADLLLPRMTLLGLDAPTVEREAPGVMQDLQRVCAQCESKRVCEHELAGGESRSDWRDYCLNSATFDAVRQQASAGEACPEPATDKVN
jgi:hypothetical protein